MGWQILGTLGAALIVLCYWQVVRGAWSPQGKQFLWVNMAGAILLIISLCFNFNLGSMLIELFWVYISVSGLLKLKKGTV